MEENAEAHFNVGDVVHHARFDYRGVVFDVDPVFSLSEEWYETMARSQPPKEEPWYHVLVDGAGHTTYVAQRNLEHDDGGHPIAHPMLNDFFSGFEGGVYVLRERAN